MTHRFRLAPAAFAAAMSIGTFPLAAHADIVGLTAGTYSYNQGDAGAPAIVGAGSIQLTTGAAQARSIWFNTRQDISHFTATFTYREQIFSSNPGGTTAGLVFVLSNSPAGTAALGTPLGLGYNGVTPSAAVSFDTFGGGSSMGFYRDGVAGGSDTQTAPLLFPVNRDIAVTVAYDGSLLSVTMSDGALTFGQSYPVGSLASSLGSSTAFVGFTAGNGDISSYHILSGFAYTVPTPAASTVLCIAGLAAARRRRT